jgi:predicted TIM-barrel fold metal-dependent hydrolase
MTYTPVSRRKLLAGAAALGAASLLPGRVAHAQGKPKVIDTHHHFYAPAYQKAWLDWEDARKIPHFKTQEAWSREKSVEELDKNGVATGMLSLASTPGTWFNLDAAAAATMARTCNDFGAEMVRDHKGRFGLFATLSMIDIDATLKEIEYVFDTLKADGVGLLTSYGDTWLGHASYRPVMEELNRRKAVVAVHPTAATCCRHLDYASGVGPGSMEYGTDTTRAIMGVAFSGDAARFRDIRFIWSHAGGTVPFLAGRIEGASSGAKAALPDGFIAELKKFYYDLAGAANRGAIASLLQLVPATQIVFGTDFPPGGTSAAVAKTLREIGMFKDSDLRAIDRENAIRLLPRFKA